MSQNYEISPQDPGESFLALPGINLTPNVITPKKTLVVPKSIAQPGIVQPVRRSTAASVQTVRRRSFISDFMASGFHEVEHWRGGRKIADYSMPNGITIEGKNFILDGSFHGSVASPSWWLGAIDLTGFSALAEGDTYDNINQAGNGWDEFTNYEYNSVATDRVPWDEAAASGKSITNSANPGVFDITGSGTVKGVFLVGMPTGGTATPGTQGDHAPTGILWSTALFTTGDVAVVNGDQLKVTYTISS